MPTLRRPATSHQRSATLQQFQSQGGFSGSPVDAKFPPLDHPYSLRHFPMSPLEDVAEVKQASGGWTSFFHSRPTKPSGRTRKGSIRGSEGGADNFQLPSKRISLQLGSRSRAYLTKASWISSPPSKIPLSTNEMEATNFDAPHKDSPTTANDPSDSTDSTTSRQARKSISMHFSSGNWIPRNGSFRRPRRSTTSEVKSGGPRHTLNPGDAAQRAADPVHKPHVGEAFPDFDPTAPVDHELNPAVLLLTRRRNNTSPLPPLSRLSSFNIDVGRLGLPASPTLPAPPQRQYQSPINYTTASQTFSGESRSRGGSGEQSSTLAGSDGDVRDGIFGDDEDTDFKSDGMFDSFRTMASNRLRTVETPIESMFDESPPSTSGNSKTKRLSIQEILGRSWDGDTKILEEDESIPTSNRAPGLGEPVDFSHRHDKTDDFDFDPADLTLDHRQFGRLSLDDDDDDDWARDDENTLSNHLSPPCSSTNSRRVSPTFREALASMSGNGMSELRRDTASDRPRSNIFDWCETPLMDKLDGDGRSLRPKTVHGKQELDFRGGRSASRKGLNAAHVRSQSVPVVPDPVDGSKPQPKFGTWGLGTKTASEDWDDDFDFEEGDAFNEPGGKDSATSFSMVVPASIQATQPTVKAHSGQIRELSLLVNDLKRLCRHGKELDLIQGSSAHKWMEAENIIALASPDEEEEEADDLDFDRSSVDFDSTKIDERFLDEGFDGSILDHHDDPFEAAFTTPEPEMGKTTVVRERQVVRRRSVFSPDDDIFGNWALPEDGSRSPQPRTPDGSRSPNRNSAVLATVIEAMQQQRAIADPVKSVSPTKASDSKLFFDTNSLQELVKRASQLRDSLSDAVRRAELLTQSPAGTPRRERHSARHNADGSPAFTRVFTDPASSPPRRLPKSHSTNSVLSKTSVESPRMHLMTVS